jgi:2-polyprenyl-3-methyl-5-hydroxy-6-metoxy-1,4-benzoquinol methylase
MGIAPVSGETQPEAGRLDYAAFARRARDERLSKYEKIGFPDSYRAGFEAAIFADICEKLPRLAESGLHILDIGPGCSELPRMLIDRCRVQGHDLHLVDSPEMLSLLADAPFIDKRPGLFPNCRADLADLLGRVDVILAYSLLHHVVLDANPFDFLDLCIQLLAPGGALLIGDIPNVSKRSRFFSSGAGVAYHRAFTGQNSLPAVAFNVPVPGQIDDAIILGLLARARAAGADAYLLPQPASLPMHNRREDILVRKP